VRNWKPGDRVTVHCNHVDDQDPSAHDDSMMAANQRIWGYETNFGGLADLAVVKANAADAQARAPHLGGSGRQRAVQLHVSYRMLVGRNGAQMKQGDVVLIWGATGGIGAYATQYVLNGGGIPVCVVSSPDKAEILRKMGVEHIIDRAAAGYQFFDENGVHNETEWRRLGKDIRGLCGEDADIVFEHPGRSTFGASMYVVKRGGTVVTCAATSGFMMEFDNRHFWMRLKKLVGSHFANYKEAYEANRLISQGHDPPGAEPGVRPRAGRRGRLPGAPQHARGQDRRARPGPRRGPGRHRPRPARQGRRQAPRLPPLTRPGRPVGSPASGQESSQTGFRTGIVPETGTIRTQNRAAGPVAQPERTRHVTAAVT
jgi:NADPH:quinone reductase-like Zn-dependent oxidoreductase